MMGSRTPFCTVASALALARCNGLYLGSAAIKSAILAHTSRLFKPNKVPIYVDLRVAEPVSGKSVLQKPLLTQRQSSPTRGLKVAAAADAGAGRPDMAQHRLVPKVGAGRSVILPRHPRTTPKCILEVFRRFGHFGKNNEAAGRRRSGPKGGSNHAAAVEAGSR